MFEQLDEPQKAQVSTAMTFGIFAAYLAGAFGGFCLFVFIGDMPFGIQIVTAITYTYFAFWYVFFPTRGLLEKYSLILRLLAIHLAFLISICLAQTVWFEMKPGLPGYRLTEHGKHADSSFGWVMIVPLTVLFFTQVLISRGILRRSLKRKSE